MSIKNHEIRDFSRNRRELCILCRYEGIRKEIGGIEKGKAGHAEKTGEILCVSGNTVHAWEADKQEPSLGVLVQIADYFEVSLDYLLGRSDY